MALRPLVIVGPEAKLEEMKTQARVVAVALGLRHVRVIQVVKGIAALPFPCEPDSIYVLPSSELPVFVDFREAGAMTVDDLVAATQTSLINRFAG